MAGRRSLLLLVAQAIAHGIAPVFAQDDVLQFVDPLIGTINGGHVFPGATLPFGMAKAVADVNSDERQGGYASDDGESMSPTCSPDRSIVTDKQVSSHRIFTHARQWDWGSKKFQQSLISIVQDITQSD